MTTTAHSDIYIFNRNSGHFIIDEIGGDNDRIQFGEDISINDLNFYRQGINLVVKLIDDSASVNIQSFFKDFTLVDAGILPNKIVEFFDFADGTSLSWNEVLNHHIYMNGTDKDDSLLGSLGNDVFHGGKGNDILTGGTGNDIYLFNLGDGHDLIDNQDLIMLTENSYEKVGKDIIKFGENITPDMLVAKRDGLNLVLSIDEDNSITIKDWYSTEQYIQMAGAVDFMEFDNGRRMNIAAWLAEYPPIISGTAKDDALLSSNYNDIYLFSKNSGNDYVYELDGLNDRIKFDKNISINDLNFSRQGENIKITLADGSTSLTIGNIFMDNKMANAEINTYKLIEFFDFADGSTLSWQDILENHLHMNGTDGSDILLGSIGNDVLHGGKGDDVLSGGKGNDTYLFNIGDGHDTIKNEGESRYANADVGEVKADIDNIQFGEGITSDMLTFTKDQNNLIIHVNNNDSITITNWYTNDITQKIDNLLFADGTRLSWDDETSTNFHIYGTGNDDVLRGTIGNDVLYGGKGNDLLSGGVGDDTYLFNLGDGHDTIDNEADIYFDKNFYQYYKVETDTIQFGLGITTKMLSCSRDGDNLLINVGKNDTITIKNWFSALIAEQTSAQVDKMVFSDGTVWNKSEINDFLDNNIVRASSYVSLAPSSDASLARSTNLLIDAMSVSGVQTAEAFTSQPQQMSNTNDLLSTVITTGAVA